jgi:DNA-binding transcriptional MerR regulator
VPPTGYRIKDVAERSGFSAPTLRYYEEIGLLPTAARTASGYRTYDDETLARLAFISRAKQLGCSLEEVAELVTAWEGGRCGPIQDRLRHLVQEKLATAAAQITELMTLSADLQRAAAALERHRPDGPCDDRCGCVVDEDRPVPSAVALITKPIDSRDDEPAIACTLEAAQMTGRLDDWHRVLEHVGQRSPIEDGVRLAFEPGVPAEELGRLVHAEQSCCSFFRFAITVDRRGTALEVRAPADARPIVDALFGVAAR